MIEDNIAAARRLFAAIDRALLVGGVAINFHGFRRYTADIDIVVPLRESDWLELVDRLQALPDLKLPNNLSWRQLRDWTYIEHYAETSPNIRLIDTTVGLKLDIMFMQPSQFDAWHARAERQPIPGTDRAIAFATARDLLTMKQAAVEGRDAFKDRADIAFLKELLQKRRTRKT